MKNLVYWFAIIFGILGFFGLCRFLVFQNGTAFTNALMIVFLPLSIGLIAYQEWRMRT